MLEIWKLKCRDCDFTFFCKKFVSRIMIIFQMEVDFWECVGDAYWMLTTNLAIWKSNFPFRRGQAVKVVEVISKMPLFSVYSHETTFADLLLIAFIFSGITFLPSIFNFKKYQKKLFYLCMYYIHKFFYYKSISHFTPKSDQNIS